MMPVAPRGRCCDGPATTIPPPPPGRRRARAMPPPSRLLRVLEVCEPAVGPPAKPPRREPSGHHERRRQERRADRAPQRERNADQPRDGREDVNPHGGLALRQAYLEEPVREVVLARGRHELERIPDALLVAPHVDEEKIEDGNAQDQERRGPYVGHFGRRERRAQGREQKPHHQAAGVAEEDPGRREVVPEESEAAPATAAAATATPQRSSA